MTFGIVIGFAAITAFIFRATPFLFRNSAILNNIQGRFYRFLNYSAQAMLGVISYDSAFGKTNASAFVAQFGLKSFSSIFLLFFAFILIARTKKILRVFFVSLLIYYAIISYMSGTI